MTLHVAVHAILPFYCLLTADYVADDAAASRADEVGIFSRELVIGTN